VEYEALRQEQQERVLLQVGRGRQAARAEFSRQERVGLGRQLQATMDRYLAGTLPAGVPGLTGTPGRTPTRPCRLTLELRLGASNRARGVQTEVEVGAVEPAHTVWVDVAGIGR
jgi:hypothetical protein